MHFGDRELGCVGMVSMLPDMAQVATGLALAFKMRREPRVAMTFFGEGSTANGQWHEAMNFAGIHRLPAVFVLENNQFAYSTPQRARVRGRSRRARRGLRLPGRVGGRKRRRGGLRGGAGRGRARARGRGPDADRVPHDAHARARRPRRHELRADGAARGVGRVATRSTATRRGWPASTGSPSRRSRRSAGGSTKEVEEGAAQGARLADAGSGAGDRGRVTRTPGSRSATGRRRGRTGSRPGPTARATAR